MMDDWPKEKRFDGPEAEKEAAEFYRMARRDAPTGVAYTLFRVSDDGSRQAFFLRDELP